MIILRRTRHCSQLDAMRYPTTFKFKFVLARLFFVLFSFSYPLYTRLLAHTQTHT